MSDFDQQFDTAFDQLANFHGEKMAVVFALFEGKNIEVSDVVVYLGGEQDSANASTRRRDVEATLSFNLRQLPRTPMLKDFAEIPGHEGRWSFRGITEQVGEVICCRFTKPEQTRHGGGNR